MAQSSFKSYLNVPVNRRAVSNNLKRIRKDKGGNVRWTRIEYNKVPGLITWGVVENPRYIVRYPEISKKYLIIRDGEWADGEKGVKLLEVLSGPFPTLKAAKAMYLLESA